VDYARALIGDTKGERYYNCQFCVKNPGMYVALGHDGPPTMWEKHHITGEPLARCPVRDLLAASETDRRMVEAYEVELYPFFEEGHLAVEGGVMDQPALYIDLMRLIRNTRKLTDAKLKARSARDGDD
jgi:hypothetical protein